MTYAHFVVGTAAFTAQLELRDGLDATLINLLTPTTPDTYHTVEAAWSCQGTNQPLCHALHVACGGPALRLKPADGYYRQFLEEHTRALANSTSALVVSLDNMRQLILAPIQNEAGKEPVFWGYIATPNVPTLTADLLSQSQIAVILDLDETLLVANTMDSLQANIQKRHELRCQLQVELSTKTGVERDRVGRQLTVLDKELELLEMDQVLLTHFVAHTSVKIRVKDGTFRLFTPRNEEGFFQSQVVKRPVVRIPAEVTGDSTLILTRIHPGDPTTSMLFRMRPDWDDLRKVLAGEWDGKRRYRVYVCTAADRDYALEAWRLLDPTSGIISKEEVGRRLVDVAQIRTGTGRKTLIQALGLGPDMEYGLRLSRAAQTTKCGDPGYLLPPLAVVIDDRKEVWADVDQAHVIHVVPWAYYKDEAARQTCVDVWQACMSNRELTRVRNAIASVRQRVYLSIDKTLRSQTDAALKLHRDADINTLARVVAPWTTAPRLICDPMWLRDFGVPDAPLNVNEFSSNNPLASSKLAYAPLAPPPAPVVPPPSKVQKQTKTPVATTTGVNSQQRSASHKERRTSCARIQNLDLWNLDNLDDVEGEPAADAEGPAAQGAAPGAAHDSETPSVTENHVVAEVAITPQPVNDAAEAGQAAHDPSVEGKPETAVEIAAIVTAAVLGKPEGTVLSQEEIHTELQHIARHNLHALPVTCLLMHAAVQCFSLLDDVLVLRDVCFSRPEVAQKLEQTLTETKEQEPQLMESRIRSIAQFVRLEEANAATETAAFSTSAEGSCPGGEAVAADSTGEAPAPGCQHQHQQGKRVAVAPRDDGSMGPSKRRHVNGRHRHRHRTSGRGLSHSPGRQGGRHAGRSRVGHPLGLRGRGQGQGGNHNTSDA